MNLYIKNISFLLLSLVFVFTACETEESIQITSPDPAFVLQQPGISNVFLNFALPENPAFTISWNDMVTGSASYNVEMSMDADFTGPILLGTTENNSFSMSVNQFNEALSSTSIKSYASTGVYMRINTGSVTSNVILFQVSKFPVTAPSITSPDNTFSAILSDADPTATALTVTWDDAEIGENSNITLDYEVQMALAETDFAASTTIGTTNSTTFEIGHEALNDLVLSSGGKADVATNFDFRIKAIVKTTSGDLSRTSSMITIALTAYKGAIPDNLFMVGAHNSWNNADASQQFYNDGNGVFVKVQTFSANDEFKLLPTSGSWTGDYGEDPVNAGKIVQEDESNIKVATAGRYVVIVNFNTLSFKLAKIDNLYMVGAHNSWNNADATQKFNTSGNGVFTRLQTFSAGDEFKMIPTTGFWDGDWGESKTTPNIVEQDDEQNIKVATAGTYMVTVDFNTLAYTVVEAPQNLFLVGSPNSWNNATAIAFTKVSEGVFELNQALATGDEFKFLPVQGSWDNDWGASKKYSGMIVRDDENNVKAPGTGTYKITVDYNKGTYTVN
ncbi:SusE domain-containing protein [Mariniflexile sp. AS56]|uniref:SusE domain-containing protein n=1 Tax=Mariniflexile sp. AS56 TaxID=3063957 RepID=UPI0026F1CB84|nr:SusE domain-containing protein [Mariniflexile sp. AS56]MDO7171738.1 SusE domain-containing protein [Mariniflexile sp. AS56]